MDIGRKLNDYASSLNYDGVNLRVRALARLAAYDRRRARSLLEGVLGALDVTDAGCTRADVPFCSALEYRALLAAFPSDIGLILARVKSPQQIAASLAAVREKETLTQRAAIPMIAGALGGVHVSDRTFTFVELQMGLGKLVQETASQTELPLEVRTRFAGAWIDYVRRTLQAPRCSVGQNGMADGDLLAVITTAQQMAKEFNIAGIAVGGRRLLRVRPRTGLPRSAQADEAMFQEATAVVRLAQKSERAGIATVERELMAQVQKLLALDSSGVGADIRVDAMIQVADLVKDQHLQGVTVDGLFDLLEHSRLKAEVPALWILRVRHAAGFGHHPNRELAEVVLRRFAASKDPDIRAYYILYRNGRLTPLWAGARPRPRDLMLSY